LPCNAHKFIKAIRMPNIFAIQSDKLNERIFHPSFLAGRSQINLTPWRSFIDRRAINIARWAIFEDWRPINKARWATFEDWWPINIARWAIFEDWRPIYKGRWAIFENRWPINKDRWATFEDWRPINKGRWPTLEAKWANSAIQTQNRPIFAPNALAWPFFRAFLPWIHNSHLVLPNVSKQDTGKKIGQSSNFSHCKLLTIFESFAYCRRIDIERHFPEMKILKNNSWQFQIKGVKHFCWKEKICNPD